MLPDFRATYRVQFHAGFRFDDAAAIADYLAELGISHLYSSPYLQASPGSTHGYDVVNHHKVNDELGGAEGHARFCAALDAAPFARRRNLMTPFTVWAPNAKRVEVEVRAARHPMAAGENGWWFTELTLTETNADYAFVLDNGPPLPDLRSPWQPGGVHGPSRLVDHNAFAWTDHRWQAPPLSSAVIYELHIGTFTPEGTFSAAIPKLDYLVQLGITHIELMPVAEFPGSRGWGYDGADLYAPHHAYGGPDGLKCLIDACHGRGLAVILDVVYNHLGPAGNYLAFFGRIHRPLCDAMGTSD